MGYIVRTSLKSFSSPAPEPLLLGRIVRIQSTFQTCRKGRSVRSVTLSQRSRVSLTFSILAPMVCQPFGGPLLCHSARVALRGLWLRGAALCHFRTGGGGQATARNY